MHGSLVTLEGCHNTKQVSVDGERLYESEQHVSANDACLLQQHNATRQEQQVMLHNMSVHVVHYLHTV